MISSESWKKLHSIYYAHDWSMWHNSAMDTYFPPFRFVLRALFKPISDYILKPFLVSFHNWICVPTCGLSHHLCVLCAHSCSPCLRMVSVLFCSTGCCSNRSRTNHHLSKQMDMSPIWIHSDKIINRKINWLITYYGI